MSEHKTGNSTYDKKTYWERRKKGLRGQGDKPKLERPSTPVKEDK